MDVTKLYILAGLFLASAGIVFAAQEKASQPIFTTCQDIAHHFICGHFGYRLGKWKLLLAGESGGRISPTERQVSEGSAKG